LFLDIEGYTKICEEMSAKDVNRVIEKCFSVIMEAIHANDGDVNETAGDGLMVLFLNEDKETNALQAVQAAATIRESLTGAGNDVSALSKPVIVNIGVNSGPALVGAVKFESYTGSRWTYTARGMTTNVAARLSALATGGKVLLSESTAERVKDRFQLTFLGKFPLKNISEDVKVFAL
ncbi:MAG: adenylate/guanylate cyclase domain-containing protein, partial [Deltaproteobacteria bacterium]|nr:adenylate/guanylate cyclase domain-containing protein [Deltaproteobacteria bacterium]